MYNQAMNAAVYDAAETLPDEKRKEDRGAFFKSIHATLNHILWADKNWLRRFVMTNHGYGKLSPDIYRNIEGFTRTHSFLIHEDFPALKAERAWLDTRIIEWVSEGLTEERLGQFLQYENARGEANSRPFADVIMHMFNHQTHHRGQVTTLLTQLGIDVGITDLIYYSNRWG
jgi:uncharacterized damage-inducible protein DinB